MSPIDKLHNLFTKFPGIGSRQARRFVYFLLDAPREYRKALSETISSLERSMSICPSCFVHFTKDAEICCEVCRNPSVDETTLLVVEKDSDYESFRKSNIHQGKFFVLGGMVPTIEKDVAKSIRITELEKVLKERPTLKEVILAFPVTPQGEHTENYLRTRLTQLLGERGLKLTTLGRGLSTGSEPEYADKETLRNALAGRR